MRKYSVVFEIVADDVDETWTHILAQTPKLPRLLEDWKNDGCRCKSRTPKEARTIQLDGKLTILWEVECQAVLRKVVSGDNSKGYEVSIYANGRESDWTGTGKLFVADLAMGADLPAGAWVLGHFVKTTSTGGNEE